MGTIIGYAATVLMMLLMAGLGVFLIWSPEKYRTFQLADSITPNFPGRRFIISYIQSDRYLIRLRIIGAGCLLFALLLLLVIIFAKPVGQLDTREENGEGANGAKSTQTSPPRP